MTKRLCRLVVRNFRSLANVDLDIGALNVLFGPNGALWDGADEDARISIRLETNQVEYEVSFGYSSGRIEPFVGEFLKSKDKNVVVVDRTIGSDKANFYHSKLSQSIAVPLREPEKLALTRYLSFEDDSWPAIEIDRLLRFVHLYPSRTADMFKLKKVGSESSHQTWLWERGQNLWSV